MGNSTSRHLPEDARKALSDIELHNVEKLFEELAIEHGTFNKKLYLDSENFSKRFLPKYPLVSKRLFDAFDTDHSGYIEFDEFVTGLALLTKGDTTSKLTLLFSMFDLDGSGFVSPQELNYMFHSALFHLNTIQETVVEKEEVRLRCLYDYTGSSQDELSFKKNEVLKIYQRYNKDWIVGQNQQGLYGYVPTNYVKEYTAKQKVKQVVNPEERINRIVRDAFLRFDTDKNGRLTLEEFHQFALESYEVSLLLDEFEMIQIAPKISQPSEASKSLDRFSIGISKVNPEILKLCREAGMSENELNDPDAMRHALKVLAEASKMKKQTKWPTHKPPLPPPHNKHPSSLPQKVNKHLNSPQQTDSRTILRSMPTPNPPKRPAPTLRKDSSHYEYHHSQPTIPRGFFSELNTKIGSSDQIVRHPKEDQGLEQREKEQKEREQKEKERKEKEQKEKEQKEKEQKEREQKEKEQKEKEQKEKEQKEREDQEKLKKESETEQAPPLPKKNKKPKRRPLPVPPSPHQTSAKLPPNWVEYRTQENVPYYYNTVTTKTVWEIPKEALTVHAPVEDKWEQFTTTAGVPYWYNAKTKESVWELPASEDKTKDSQPASQVPAAPEAPPLNLNLNNNSTSTTSNRDNLLSQIRLGTTLKPVEESSQEEKEDSDSRGGLLAAIRKGVLLKKVETPDIDDLDVEDKNDLTGILARALTSRRNYISEAPPKQEDDDDEWNYPSDSEWE